MKYSDLIFDLYGTLVDIHTEESDSVWEKTAIYFGYYGAPYTGAELKDAFHTELSLLESKADSGISNFPDFPHEVILSKLFLRKGIVNNADALAKSAAQLFRILSTEYITLYPEVLEALYFLRKNGYRLWLLSNAQRIFTEYELRYLGLTDCFDGIYISSDYGYRKPDTRFFNVLIREHNLKPEKCLMIGNDRETDIAGARNAGIDTLYMHTNLTPQEQAPADPAAMLRKCDKYTSYEFEGAHWKRLVEVILNL